MQFISFIGSAIMIVIIGCEHYTMRAHEDDLNRKRFRTL